MLARLAAGAELVARVARALQNLLRVQRGRQRLRDVTEDLAAALVVALDLVPVADDVAGSLRGAIAEDMGMAPDQLLAAVLGHLGQAAPAALLHQQREEIDLEQDVA